MIQSMLTKESPEIIRFFGTLRACPNTGHTGGKDAAGPER